MPMPCTGCAAILGRRAAHHCPLLACHAWCLIESSGKIGHRTRDPEGTWTRGGAVVTCEMVLMQAIAMLQRLGRGRRNPRRHGGGTPWTVHSVSTRIQWERCSVTPVALNSKSSALHAAR